MPAVTKRACLCHSDQNAKPKPCGRTRNFAPALLAFRAFFRLLTSTAIITTPAINAAPPIDRTTFPGFR
ncbi:hypothetical protein ENSA7_81770 [Enhygromyxa salina]|uniref:Uncharacterized protein n=1 Tax=Enhygromyxa salina TaxID=215803 RepID=A0A2S9XGG0_9BACT|nr:hypothetical protein ENSA7_81770 [Enhygromyxa salina]